MLKLVFFVFFSLFCTAKASEFASQKKLAVSDTSCSNNVLSVLEMADGSIGIFSRPHGDDGKPLPASLMLISKTNLSSFRVENVTGAHISGNTLRIGISYAVDMLDSPGHPHPQKIRSFALSHSLPEAMVKSRLCFFQEGLDLRFTKLAIWNSNEDRIVEERQSGPDWSDGQNEMYCKGNSAEFKFGNFLSSPLPENSSWTGKFFTIDIGLANSMGRTPFDIFIK